MRGYGEEGGGNKRAGGIPSLTAHKVPSRVSAKPLSPA